MIIETTKAIKKSIQHHKKNLRLLQTTTGEFSNPDGKNYFMIGIIKISYDAKDCALCKKFTNGCCRCPLAETENDCNEIGSAWDEFRYVTTKKNAIEVEENMIEVLKELIK